MSGFQHGFADAKNVDVGEKGEIWGDNPEMQKPSFPGPGQNATAASAPRPHATRTMNQADPRLDQGILEANQKEREQTKQDEEKLMEVQNKWKEWRD